MNLQTPRILWGALLFSNAIYLGILVFLNASSPERAALHPAAVMLPAFAAVALSSAAMSVLLPGRIHAAGARALSLQTREDVKDDPMGATQGFRLPASSERVFVDPAAARRGALAIFMQPLILGLALAESVSLFGFVLGFLGFALPMVLPFFAVGVALQAWRFPTRAAVVGPLERQYGARLRD